MIGARADWYRTKGSTSTFILIFALLGLVLLTCVRSEQTLLNISYDVTREFYREYNAAFAAEWKAKTGEVVTINQSHGGSSKQARSVIDGLEADVVTMNQVTDMEALVQVGLVAKDWADRLPHKASPYTSTIVFIARRGNPKKIRDWEDLVKPGVEVIIPNPKTSGNGRYSYLAAWAHAVTQPGAKQDTAREFVTRLFRNVPVLDTGGRGASTTFAQRGIGDVLLTFENEAALTVKELGEEQLEIVFPSSSIIAEAPVAVVDKWVAKHGTREVATAYLKFLFEPQGQEIAARHHLRPRRVLTGPSAQFPSIKQQSIEKIFGGWGKVQEVHFKDGGLFDAIYLR